MRAVVFDLDDTLISESQYQKSAQQAVLAFLSNELGLPLEVIEYHSRAVESGPRTDYFQRLLKRLGVQSTDAWVSTLISVHRNHEPILDWYSDVPPALDELRNLGMKLAVITDGYSIAQHKKLDALGAHSHFDSIVVSDDFGRQFWKPHPLVFRETADRLSVQPPEMLYVGDNPEKDFYVSKSLGIQTVRITRPDSIKANKPYRDDVKETFSVVDLSEVAELVRDLNCGA